MPGARSSERVRMKSNEPGTVWPPRHQHGPCWITRIVEIDAAEPAADDRSSRVRAVIRPPRAGDPGNPGDVFSIRHRGDGTVRSG